MFKEKHGLNKLIMGYDWIVVGVAEQMKQASDLSDGDFNLGLRRTFAMGLLSQAFATYSESRVNEHLISLFYDAINEKFAFAL